MITDAVQIDTRHARPERNPAVTGQLVANARRHPSAKLPPTAIHYYAKTTYRTNWFYILLYSLSIIASIFYFVVRVIYISTGKKSVKIPLNTTIVFGGENVTVSEALNDRVAIGDEIPQSTLDDPAFADLRAVRALVLLASACLRWALSLSFCCKFVSICTPA